MRRGAVDGRLQRLVAHAAAIGFAAGLLALSDAAQAWTGDAAVAAEAGEASVAEAGGGETAQTSEAGETGEIGKSDPADEAGEAAGVAPEKPAEREFARRGFSLRTGAAFGFENSAELDRTYAELLAAFTGFVATLPPGSTLDALRLDAQTAYGVSIGFGYRVHPRLGVEVGFDWARGFVDFDYSITVPSLGTGAEAGPVGTWTLWCLTTDLQLYLATGRVQPYAAIGVGALAVDVELVADRLSLRSGQTDFSSRFGGGVDVYLTRDVAIGVDAGYVLAAGKLDGEDMVTLRVGLIGRF